MIKENFFESKLSLPRPNFLALNSKSALNLLEKNGYPQSELKLVEALRHLYLNKIINSSSTKQKNNPNNLSTFNLLIFGIIYLKILFTKSNYSTVYLILFFQN